MNAPVLISHAKTALIYKKDRKDGTCMCGYAPAIFTPDKSLLECYKFSKDLFFEYIKFDFTPNTEKTSQDKPEAS